MKRIIVNAYEAALIKKRGKVIKILSEGRHWVAFGVNITLVDLELPLTEDLDLSVILKNDKVAELLDVHTIKDNELGFELKNGIYNRAVSPGKVAYWKSSAVYELVKVDLNDFEVDEAVIKRIPLKFVIGTIAKTYHIQSYEKGLLYVDGTYKYVLEPGVYYFQPHNKNIVVSTIDTRVQTLEILGQEILTKDKVGIRINFHAQYQVVDMHRALRESKDYQVQLYVLLQIAMREYLGSMTLDQLLSNKHLVGGSIVKESLEKASELGVTIKSGGIKDIILPGDIKEIMNQVLIAQKKAQANTIARQEETASTRSLLNTARLMEDNGMLLKLKEMEYMEKIADKIGEITLNGGSRVMDQLKDLVIAK